MIERLIKLSKNNDLFLFGARGTGKSTLLREVLPADSHILWIDLLSEEDETRFGRHPKELSYILAQNNYEVVVIDEIQKSPKLLDIVHQEIEKKNKRQFVLTGSSARKLKRGSGNLLAGRAFTYTLFPFSTYELKDLFDLNNVLEFGALPKLLEFNEHEDKLDFLRSYCQTYLREEIQIEQIVRNLNPFRDFLEMAAQLNGKIINYSKMARQIAIDDKTIHNYFQILEDTLIGFFLPPFNRSIRKRQRESPKFYFIDPGIKRALDQSLRVKLLPQTYAYGDAFEHWVILECVKLNQYLKLDYKLSYLRTKDNAEIDLVIQRPAQGDLLIEIKSSQQVDQTDVLSLTRFSKSWDKENKAILLSNDPHSKNFEDVTAYHWKSGLEKIFFEFDPLPNTP